MPGTRSSARQAANNPNSSPQSTKSSSAGTKRKSDDSSPVANTKSKRGRPSKASKEQKTLEETLPDTDGQMKNAENEQGGAEAKLEANGRGEDDYQRPKETCTGWMDKVIFDIPDANGGAKGEGANAIENADDRFKGNNKEGEDKGDADKGLKDSRGGAGLNALDQVRASEKDGGKTNKEPDAKDTAQTSGGAANGERTTETAIEMSKEREKAQPSNVLEKGIIYFFTRGRVGVEDPKSVQELQRSYFVLRPLAGGAKITDGAIQDIGNNRLIALPKKVWPKSGRDRFMVFVEKGAADIKTLKEEFFQGSEYSTKTTGTRQTPEVTPVGEGVYAITSTGGGRGQTHLAYMLTIPRELGEVQKDVGLAAKGSFICSLKNPESGGPPNAQLPTSPGYPKGFIEEFAGRGWMPMHPKHLDYASGQMLLIGENFDTSKNLEADDKDASSEEKETPQEELEKLKGEDELRVEHLKGDDTIFADLGISSEEYPKVMTTW